MATNYYFFCASPHTPDAPLHGKCASITPPSDSPSQPESSLSLSDLPGKHWFVQIQGGKHKALSSEDIADILAQGLSVHSLAGPFDTHEQASQSLERYWDALMGDDD